ncbi:MULTISPECIES: hypothetical protein [Streptomyces]|uniref:hypothetical protein n=1 Tax=Streptomyces TaxID=1883 RepID=UPI00167034C7|nr:MULTISPECIES: hypothetical protein [Streptomyces]UFR07413.1 hypothetical protein KBP30_18735 [Streptomyces sp. Go40/10]GGS85777.1 hypothetical protein GCM10010206_55640 [Streptomyces cinerochromogenes]
MAFGVEELRVLRRALALALHPGHASAEDVQDCFRLAESLDEAMCEGARLRAFLVADLGRYRAALPGTVTGYLSLLEEALGAGHRPTPDDLAALRALRGNPAAAALLDRCQALAEQDVRARFAQGARKVPAPAVPPARTRLLALAGGAGDFGVRQDDGEAEEPSKAPQEPAEKPVPEPAPAPGEHPAPKRPIPTPGEVFPRRKPAPPSDREPRRLAAG